MFSAVFYNCVKRFFAGKRVRRDWFYPLRQAVSGRGFRLIRQGDPGDFPAAVLFIDGCFSEEKSRISAGKTSRRSGRKELPGWGGLICYGKQNQESGPVWQGGLICHSKQSHAPDAGPVFLPGRSESRSFFRRFRPGKAAGFGRIFPFPLSYERAADQGKCL